jgi:ectoine hydroxylase-related dioxygenase (phytanoyl-CoA dioxygenase family)
MPTPPATLLPSEEDVARFEADGAIILRGVFRDWIKTLRAGVEETLASPSALERSYRPKDGSSPFFQDFCNWPRIEAFRRFVFESPAGAVAARLMRSRTARFFHDHVLVKEPGTSVVTPWHQDQPYYCVDGRQSVSFWTPLDPVARDVSLECVAGSHKWGKDHRPKRFDGTDLYAGDPSEEMPDIDQHRNEFRIVGWAMEPGDAVAFNFRTVHGAPGNTSPSNRRRVFSARWVGADAVFVDRHGKGSPAFAHLKLRNGDPLDVPDFPLAYTEPA